MTGCDQCGVTAEDDCTMDCPSRAGVAADPVGLSDIARRLGVAQQTAKQWKLRGLLPEPKWIVGGRPAWDWPQIEKWARKTGRL